LQRGVEVNNLTRRVIALDAYLVVLVFFCWLAIGLGLGIGLFIAAVLIGIVKRVGA